MKNKAANDNSRSRYKKVRRPKAGPYRKSTDIISLKSARTFMAAFRLARHLGAELNRFSTIHWALAQSSTVAPFDRIGLILDRYKAWARRQGFVPAWTYVREKQSSPIEHVHFAFHVPKGSGAAFNRALQGWVAKESDHPVADCAIDDQFIKIGTAHRVARYFLKGGDALVRSTYGVQGRPAQGRIAGKRIACSTNIGASAQARHQREIDEMELAEMLGA